MLKLELSARSCFPSDRLPIASLDAFYSGTVRLKRYLVVVGMLIAIVLAIVTITPMVFPSQSQLVATTTESQQSFFYTTVTTIGDVTITEVLPNTAAQVRPANPSSQSSSSDFAPLGQLAFLLFSVVIVFGYKLSGRT